MITNKHSYFFPFQLNDSLLTVILFGFITSMHAQMVLNNNPFVVINGGTSSTPAYLVINNSSASGITLATAQVNGGIKSESEFNMVKWNIGTGTGNFSVPFTKSSAGPAMPVSVNITGAGTGAGSILFSTYPGATWDNATYMPSDVTNMNSAVGGPNNSAMVVDRFWILDASSYTAKPTASLSFTYDDPEWSATGNSITEGNLGAQRFNTPAGNWDNYLPQGISNTATNMVNAVPATPTDFFRSWTLVDHTSPLPIELLDQKAECQSNTVNVSWITATETNNDFFTVERSSDGYDFDVVGLVDGAGTSTVQHTYEYKDLNPLSGTAYYRLKQTDFDGKTVAFPLLSSSCSNSTSGIDVYPNPGHNEIFISGASAGTVFGLVNDLGQVIRKVQVVSDHTAFDISGLEAGIYFLISDNSDIAFRKKMVVQ